MSQRKEQEIKKQIYERFAQIGKALGSASRLKILDLLAQSEYPVDNLAQEAGLSVANASQHLKTLRTAGMVEVRRQGVVAYYRLANEEVLRAWQSLRRLGEVSMVEIEWLANQLTVDGDPPAIVSFDELVQLQAEGCVTVLDVRPGKEYAAGHIPGACSIPLGELPERVAEVSLEQEVIVCGRGPYCTLSYRALSLLRARGYRARLLAQGLPEWRIGGRQASRGALPGSTAAAG
jgi:DNA-binding transcriptional ArsR family regulator/rhodanese-related sulfurtransferase